MAGALGVCIGALSFAFNMRATAKNRKVTFTNNMLSSLWSKESNRDIAELMSMQWTDYDDFYRKYDSSVNPENWAKRIHYYVLYNNVGWQLRSGMIDWDTLYRQGDFGLTLWRKFGPVIKEYEKRGTAKYWYKDWEYLAGRVEEEYSLEDKKRQKYMDEHAFEHGDVTPAKENKQ